MMALGEDLLSAASSSPSSDAVTGMPYHPATAAAAGDDFVLATPVTPAMGDLGMLAGWQADNILRGLNEGDHDYGGVDPPGVQGMEGLYDMGDAGGGGGLADFDFDFDLDLDVLLTRLNQSKGENITDTLSDVLSSVTKSFHQTSSNVSGSTMWTIIVSYAVCIVVGLSGNLLILWAILSKPKMRTARNIFIVTLSTSDLLLCTFAMPLTLWDVLSKEWPFGLELEWLCKIAHCGQDIPVYMSSQAIVAIAFDRFRCIMQPDRPHFSSTTAIFLSLMMGAVSIALTVPLFASAKVTEFLNSSDLIVLDIKICQDTWDGKGKAAYTVTSMCFQFVLPLIIVITLYLNIYFRLRNRPQSQHAENNLRRRRANHLIVAIAVIFFLSWLPLNVFSLFMEVYPDLLRPHIEGAETVIYAFAHLCGLCNACINPILYGYLNENFRKEYRNIYRKMPWYSTTTNQHVAIHMQITAPGGGKFNPGGGGGRNNNVVSPGTPAEIMPRLNEEEEDEDNSDTDEYAAKPMLANGSVAHHHGQQHQQQHQHIDRADNEDKPCVIFTSETPLLEPTIARDALAKVARERRLSLTGCSQQQHPLRLQKQGSVDSCPPSSSTTPNNAEEDSALARLGFSKRMILPGLGLVRVERGRLRRQGHTNKTVLERVSDSEGDAESPLLWEQQELHVVFVSTKSTGQLRKTIRRKEEELKKRRKRLSSKGASPMSLTLNVFNSAASSSPSEGIKRSASRERPPITRSASTCHENGGAFRRSLSVHGGGGSNGAVARPRFQKQPSLDVPPPARNPKLRERKHSLGSSLSPSAPPPVAPKEEPEVKIVSVGDVCSKSSGAANSRRRLSLQHLPITELLTHHHHHHHHRSDHVQPPQRSTSHPGQTASSARHAAKFKFVEWSPEEEIEEEEEEEDDVEEGLNGHDTPKPVLVNGKCEGPVHPMDLQGLEETIV